mgnify:CR=1 FL=1
MYRKLVIQTHSKEGRTNRHMDGQTAIHTNPFFKKWTINEQIFKAEFRIDYFLKFM